MTPPINIDGSDITGGTIDGTDFSEVTVDGTTVFSTIPDSAINRYHAPNQSETDGQTVDPWDDIEGSVNLAATNTPTLNAASVNNVDAIDLNGTDEGYSYDTNLSGTVDEPITIIWSYNVESLPSSDIKTLYIDQTENINEILLRTDNSEYQFRIDGTNASGGPSPSTGDKIITLTVSSSNGAVLRINGADGPSIAASNIDSGQPILDGSNAGGFYFDSNNSGRNLDCLAVETTVYGKELTGTELTDEEGRHESNANMSVL